MEKKKIPKGEIVNKKHWRQKATQKSVGFFFSLFDSQNTQYQIWESSKTWNGKILAEKRNQKCSKTAKTPRKANLGGLRSRFFLLRSLASSWPSSCREMASMLTTLSPSRTTCASLLRELQVLSFSLLAFCFIALICDANADDSDVCFPIFQFCYDFLFSFPFRLVIGGK